MIGRCAIFVSSLLIALPAMSETVIANRTIRAKEIIMPSDVNMSPDDIPGMASGLPDVQGLEARRILYAGRPIALSDVGPPALVNRNQIVALAYNINGLTIQTEGRSLGRGGLGDRIRVINLDSRTTVSGKIDATGVVQVGE
ncbi:flagellar basal body P-ring formation chaperone FlgA [uncultured Litoreibacter sp.]|uniref:flagellar basal body P-ring formation chaperone FlgA n=2 Tax=uncultured Litoreibacter sp. TaxID=1392394 RepID=UPI00260FFB41|nr:flagellar basal body P-ring formation chaperone FlgA [uncultured Litoreibacter sp.]